MYAAAVGRANDDRAAPVAGRAVAQFRRLADDLVHRRQDEVGELLTLRHDPEQNRADVHARAAAKIENIEQKIKTLAAMKSVLSGLIERCEHCASEDCPILASLEQGTAI